ncbi:FAM69 protein-kinase domain, partial [Trinorchestia longiramus]
MLYLRTYYRKLLACAGAFVLVLLFILSQLSDSLKQKLDNNGDHSSVEHILPANYRKSARFEEPYLFKVANQEERNKLGELLTSLCNEDACPACLGSDLCEDISSGFLTLLSEAGEFNSDTQATEYPANIGVNHSVRLQVVDSKNMERATEALCGNGVAVASCGVKLAAVRWPYITSVEPLSASVAYSFLTAIGENIYTRPLLMCPTPLSLSVIEAAFASDPVSSGSGVPTPSDKLNLLTALAVAPGFTVQKMTERLQLSPASVGSLGACGRAWLSGREKLTPLVRLLEEAWSARAALGAQLIGMVEDMLESSEEWLVFIGMWSPNRLMVSSDGELLLQDSASVSVIDKSTLSIGASGEYGREDDLNTLGRVCNGDCFAELLGQVLAESQFPVKPPPSPSHQDHNSIPSKPSRDKTIFNNEHKPRSEDELSESMRFSSRSLAFAQGVPYTCAHEDLFAHIMYASVCAFVLSDDPAHHTLDYFPQLSGPPDPQYKGLLHSAPVDVASQVKKLLKGCVVETSGGERLRSVEDLKD